MMSPIKFFYLFNVMKENKYMGNRMSNYNSEEEPIMNRNAELTEDVSSNKIAQNEDSFDADHDQHSMWWLNVRRRCHKHSSIKRSHIRRKH